MHIIFVACCFVGALAIAGTLLICGLAVAAIVNMLLDEAGR